MWRWWCGRGSVRSIVVKEGEIGSALNLSSLKKSKKKKKAAKENPYSSLGLDKFSSLLSILEARRTGIEAESEDTPTTILWFRFTESNDCVPIFKNFKNDTKETGRREMPSESQPAPAEHAQDKNVNEVSKEMGIKKVKAWSWKDWASESHPFLLLALLLLSLMFSRVFAIYCATIWWYLVPRIQGKDPRRKSRRLMRKKSVIV
ncbi:uncharacterized protein LOC122026632 [Zingiber officinale]|uniref:ZCF37 n=1 Tax=Zingiber officinale TaxID=94328 RepID=A0A8J5EED6_ZINOF|nr:uncharacterized protein LOC122026632 [Zingiber officinale]KAG6474064.1 hypothetical protein ZIOFF_067988 [Zingiber officinale]